MTSNQPAPGPSLVDRKQAARMLGVCANTITNLQGRGDLPSVKILSRRLFDVEDLRALVARLKGGAPE